MSGMLSIIHLPLLANTAAGKIATAAFFAPFLAVDFVKAVVVILISLKLRPVVAMYLYEPVENE